MTAPAIRYPLLHIFPSFEIGGSQMRFATLANCLAARYRHVILAMDNRHQAASLLNSDVDYTLLPYTLNKRSSPANLLAYRRIIRDSGARRLVTYNWGATEWGLANLIGGIPHLHIEDGFGPEETRRQIPRRVWFRRLALARAQPIVLPSRTLEKIARDIWGFAAEKIAYVPNGVDCTRFEGRADPALCAELGLDGGIPIIGTVAGLRPEKNVARLLRAFALVLKHHRARLAIAGTGTQREMLAALAQELGIAPHVVFAGHLARVERILPAFSVYTISSDTEQMPISLIEAMAASLPVAAVNVGDIASMVAAENRPFITPVDEVPLATAMADLLADPGRRRRIGSANADKARSDFSEDRMIAAYDALYSGRPLPA
ncbi:MAG: glycosyltransferase [Rhodospirillales bacterium]|nr:glycosyltransferase [Rhodospirillales bacterium]